MFYRKLCCLFCTRFTLHFIGKVLYKLQFTYTYSNNFIVTPPRWRNITMIGYTWKIIKKFFKVQYFFLGYTYNVVRTLINQNYMRKIFLKIDSTRSIRCDKKINESPYTFVLLSWFNSITQLYFRIRVSTFSSNASVTT